MIAIERHGHVAPLLSRPKARCGGPAMCQICLREMAHDQGRALAERTAKEMGVAVENEQFLDALTQMFMEGFVWKPEAVQDKYSKRTN